MVQALDILCLTIAIRKKNLIFGLPETIDDKIIECPHCKYSLDKEINSNENASSDAKTPRP